MAQRSGVCAGDVAYPSCTSISGATIDIEVALFGRTNGQPGCGNTITYDCLADNATAIVRGVCDGNTECSIPAITAVFGTPCPPGVSGYLWIDYDCIPPPNTTAVVLTTPDPITAPLSTAAPAQTVAPTTVALTTSEGTTSNPTTPEPVPAPTTLSPTTLAPTTVVSTTTEPRAIAATTVDPLTVGQSIADTTEANTQPAVQVTTLPVRAPVAVGTTNFETGQQVTNRVANEERTESIAIEPVTLERTALQDAVASTTRAPTVVQEPTATTLQYPTSTLRMTARTSVPRTSESGLFNVNSTIAATNTSPNGDTDFAMSQGALAGLLVTVSIVLLLLVLLILFRKSVTKYIAVGVYENPEHDAEEPPSDNHKMTSDETDIEAAEQAMHATSDHSTVTDNIQNPSLQGQTSKPSVDPPSTTSHSRSVVAVVTSDLTNAMVEHQVAQETREDEDWTCLTAQVEKSGLSVKLVDIAHSKQSRLDQETAEPAANESKSFSACDEAEAPSKVESSEIIQDNATPAASEEAGHLSRECHADAAKESTTNEADVSENMDDSVDPLPDSAVQSSPELIDVDQPDSKPEE